MEMKGYSLKVECKEYVIYQDGRVKGFGEHAMVTNYFPLAKREALLRSHRQQLGERPSAKAVNRVPRHSSI